MFGLDHFRIDLKALRDNELRENFSIDDDFFKAIEAPLIQSGKLNVELLVRKIAGCYEIRFHSEGEVTVACDLCLEDMQQPVCADNRLIVKMGEEYSEDDDEHITIDADEGILDVAWYIYEFIALSVPARHVHAPGKCNDAMLRILEEHSAATRSSDAEDADDAIDPRWSKLKDINIKNLD